MRRALRSLFERILHRGVDGSAPAFLVDRIVYSNWVYIVATIVNAMAAQANVSKGYVLLLVLNCMYQVGIALGFVLNARRHYLTGRLVFLGIIYGTLGAACAIQGPVVQMEHFYLPFSVLALSMFHPSERRYSFGFVIAGALLYLYFAARTQPLLDANPGQLHYAADDLTVNKVSYTVLLVLSVLGMSNAYGRAIKAVDDQRAKLFEHGRLSAIGSMACNVAHEINTPLMASRDAQTERRTARRWRG
jgi:signal transduction histidine kinase